jgi:hypothetical protein
MILPRPLLIVGLLAIAAGSASAQGAWVDEKGSLSLDLGYEYVPSSQVVFAPGTNTDTMIFTTERPTVNHVFSLGLSYVPIEKLEVELSLPLSMVKYTGTESHEPMGKWDDGKNHTTLTDLRAGVRYQLLEAPLVVSPHIAGSIPLADYEVVGFATGGRHIKMLHVGATAARTFDPVIPMLYLAAGYELSLGERSKINECTEGVGQMRSDVGTQLGYILLDGKLDINAGFTWRVQHQGVSFKNFANVPPACREAHDAVLKEEFMFAGVGAGYAITEKLSIQLTTRFFLRGYNTRNQQLYGLDLTWQIL